MKNIIKNIVDKILMTIGLKPKPKFKVGDVVRIVINKDVPEGFVHTAFSEKNEGMGFTIKGFHECLWIHGYSNFWYNSPVKGTCAYEEDLVKIQ